VPTESTREAPPPVKSPMPPAAFRPDRTIEIGPSSVASPRLGVEQGGKSIVFTATSAPQLTDADIDSMNIGESFIRQITILILGLAIVVGVWLPGGPSTGTNTYPLYSLRALWMDGVEPWARYQLIYPVFAGLLVFVMGCFPISRLRAAALLAAWIMPRLFFLAFIDLRDSMIIARSLTGYDGSRFMDYFSLINLGACLVLSTILVRWHRPANRRIYWLGLAGTMMVALGVFLPYLDDLGGRSPSIIAVAQYALNYYGQVKFGQTLMISLVFMGLACLLTLLNGPWLRGKTARLMAQFALIAFCIYIAADCASPFQQIRAGHSPDLSRRMTMSVAKSVIRQWGLLLLFSIALAEMVLGKARDSATDGVGEIVKEADPLPDSEAAQDSRA
jgi:hypothetical protein